jgi:hypothetical protein
MHRIVLVVTKTNNLVTEPDGYHRDETALLSYKTPHSLFSYLSCHVSNFADAV